MHIIRFEAQNIQRLSAVTIEPSADSSAIVLAGANEEGKSSCLDAIVMALAGERVIPPEPIRRGADKGHVIVDLGDMIVTRRFTAKGTSLTVTNREGLRYPSPQVLLDAFYNKLTFDPMAFAEADETKQIATLRKLANLDTSAVDAARQKLYDARTEINRDVARAKGALEKAEHYPEVTEPQDVGVIVAQLDDAERLAKVYADADRQLTIAEGVTKSASDRVARATIAVDAARQALERAERELADAQGAIQSAEQVHDERLRERDVARQAVPDTAALRAQLATVQAHNRKLDANARRNALQAELDRYQQEAADHTQRIEEIDAEKVARLSAAKFPVEGLGLTDAGVTWKGLPFRQASTAIRTRVSAAIGFALNPKLRILLVRNGNDLDAKNLKLLADAAAEAGGQVWIERIAGGDGLQTVVIEDGAVKGAPVEGSATFGEAAPPQEPQPDAAPSKAAAVPAPDAPAPPEPPSPRRPRGVRRQAPGLLIDDGGAQ